MVVRLAGGVLALLIGGIGMVDGYLALGRMSFHQDVLKPGWYLVAISLFLMVCGVLFVIVQRQDPRLPEPDRQIVPGGGAKPDASGTGSHALPIRVWGALIAYAALAPVLGYALSTLLFFAVLFHWLGVRPRRLVGLAAVGFSVAFYLVFVWLAGVSLPQGALIGLFT